MSANASQLQAGIIDEVRPGDALDAVATLAAEAAGGAVAIVLPALGIAVGSDRRLPAVRRFVAARMAGEPCALPLGFVADALVRSGDYDLGAVVLLDDGRACVPHAYRVLRLAAAASVAAAALHDAPGAGANAAGELLDDLRRTDVHDDTLVARARRLGADLTSGAVALRARVVPERSRRAVTVITSVAPGSLVATRGDEIEALLPGESDAAQERAQRVVAHLEGDASVGVAAHEPAPGRMRRALREAEVALALVDAADATPAEAARGTWQLLIRLAVSDPTALRRLRDTSVAPAIVHDVGSGGELLKTFRVYLALRGNMNAAAAAIPAHRHTVAYRLGRLRELTGLDPAHPEDRERLSLGVKAQRVLAVLDG